jgi:osmotically inducible protein OsmC
MTIKKTASAEWSGGLKDGTGFISTETKALDRHPYGFKARFEEGPGTNPEELIGAAHAGCFTMALAARLTEAGHPPQSLDTRADVDLSMEGGPTVSAIRLKVTAKVPGIDEAKFRSVADDAKQNCPVSKALSAVPIALEAELIS